MIWCCKAEFLIHVPRRCMILDPIHAVSSLITHILQLPYIQNRDKEADDHARMLLMGHIVALELGIMACCAPFIAHPKLKPPVIS